MNRREFLSVNLLAAATVLMSRGSTFSQASTDIDALIKQMSLDEKVQLLRGDGDFSSMGNTRLGLPGISMADSPQGVRIEGTSTVFPSPVAMAASWDANLIERVGAALGRELKAKGRDVLLGPCVNIHRSPLGGRNVESFGEDPFLSGSIAAAYVRGVQSEGVAACVKHFAANNLETRRLFLDVAVDLRYLHEIELPPFKMAVQPGGALAIMASYNQVNGHYSWANRYLLTDVLRKRWNFKGVIISDWGCEWMLPEDRSVLESIDAGLNIHMPSAYYYGNSLAKFVKAGEIKETRIDELVKQVLTVINKLSPTNTKKKIDQSQADTKEHHILALSAAANSIVLLKNEKGILPLGSDKIRSLAVIGPNADSAQLGDRGSVFAPVSYSVSPLEGLRNKLANSILIRHCRGFEVGNFKTIPSSALKAFDGQGGLLGQFYLNKDMEGKPVLTRVADTVSFEWGMNPPKEVATAKTFTARWSGKLLIAETKTIFIGLRSNGASKLFIDGKLLIENVGTWEQKVDPKVPKYARLDLVTGTARDIRVEYSKGEKESAIHLLWADVHPDPFAEAIAAAKKCDYAIVFAGLNIDHEGEGLDRFDMNLPDLQNELIEAVAAANPKTVVVINSGTPNDMSSWIRKVPGVLQAWYAGIEGGNAIADVLFGDVNPSGKLPVTFGKRREDYGDFPSSKIIDDKITYAESISVGYRHFDANKVEPLFPFGHGLSYTNFIYSGLNVRIINKIVEVTFNVKNTGKIVGQEVAQLYVSPPAGSLPRPPKELKAFQKVKLAAGKSERVIFHLNKDSFSFFDPKLEEWAFEQGKFGILVGTSSGDIRLEKMVNLMAESF